MLELAQAERADCEAELASIEEEIVRVMTPKDEADDRNIILEVRAGTGKGRKTQADIFESNYLNRVFFRR